MSGLRSLIDNNIQSSAGPPDLSFPGENWYLYWKSSSSLWRSKLESNPASLLLVPVFWGFHCGPDERYDFGLERPEGNLAGLYRIASELGKELIFLLPLSPFPFLPNGGVPHHLANTLILNEQKRGLAVVDPQGRVNKLYSQFDPRVFQAFRKFVREFSKCLNESGVSSDVIGAISGYCSNGKFKSYLEDSSKSFEVGFERFISAVKKDKSKEAVAKLKNKAGLKLEYISSVENLYEESAKDYLGDSWTGTMKFGFLGGGPEEIVPRSFDSLDYHGRYFAPLFEMVCNNVVPSSILLPPGLKGGVLSNVINDIVDYPYIDQKRDNKVYEDDYIAGFTPLSFFELYQGPMATRSNSQVWSSSGLQRYLLNRYRWTYRIRSELRSLVHDDYITEQTIIVSGEKIDLADFNIVLRLFTNGAKVLLDTFGMDSTIRQKLELFFVENSIKVENVNYITQVRVASLGTGTLMVFDSENVQSAPTVKQLSFWDNLLQYFQIKHIKVDEEDGVEFYWKTRSPNPNELNFEEIRQVCIYNPTSYKKKVKIYPHKNFCFIKVDESNNVKVNSTTMGITIELLPSARVKVNFGFYQD